MYQGMFCYRYKFVLFVALFWMFLLSAPFHILYSVVSYLHSFVSMCLFYLFLNIPLKQTHIPKLQHKIFWAGKHNYQITCPPTFSCAVKTKSNDVFKNDVLALFLFCFLFFSEPSKNFQQRIILYFIRTVSGCFELCVRCFVMSRQPPSYGNHKNRLLLNASQSRRVSYFHVINKSQNELNV